MPFQIRPATAADSNAAVSVVREVFDEYGFTGDEEDYNADLHDLKSHYLDPGDYFWIAEINGAAVGTCALEFFDRLPGTVGGFTHIDGKTRIAAADCSLERLYVRPSARRIGLGRALLLQAVEAAIQTKRSVMEIWSDKKLTKAHLMYERFGAIRVGDRILDDPDQSHEWGMALQLNEELIHLLRGGR